MLISKTRDAKSDAFSAISVPIDHDLQRLIDTWPNLPEGLRAGILAIIDAARKNG